MAFDVRIPSYVWNRSKNSKISYNFFNPLGNIYKPNQRNRNHSIIHQDCYILVAKYGTILINETRVVLFIDFT